MFESIARDFARHSRANRRRHRRKLRKVFSIVFLGLMLTALTVGFVLLAEYARRH